MVHFYQLFFNTVNVMLKLYTSLWQKAKCTLFVWSTVGEMVNGNHSCMGQLRYYVN